MIGVSTFVPGLKGNTCQTMPMEDDCGALRWRQGVVNPQRRRFVCSRRTQHKLVTEMRSTNLKSDGKTCLRPARRHGDRRLSRQIHDVGEGCPALRRDILPL